MAGARWFVLVFGIATFRVAAKTHGRQLRLERELAAYWHVTFGAQNPAFVEALWRRERPPLHLVEHLGQEERFDGP